MADLDLDAKLNLALHHFDKLDSWDRKFVNLLAVGKAEGPPDMQAAQLELIIRTIRRLGK